jgi:hypothetical protein
MGVWTAGALATLFAAPFALHGAAYALAAAARRRARRACPFDDDDHDTLTPLRAVQLVAAESLLWLYAMGTALRPAVETSPSRPRSIPIVVLVPASLPRSAVRVLVGRLRADGFSVLCPRLAPISATSARRVQRLDRLLRATWEQSGCREVDVLAVAGAAIDVVTHLAAGGSGVPAVRRLLTLGAAGSQGAGVPPPTEAIAFYSPDDPLLGSVARARRPEALNVTIRALGRLGLLHAPHVYALVREHLLAPALHPDPSWTSGKS